MLSIVAERATRRVDALALQSTFRKVTWSLLRREEEKSKISCFVPTFKSVSLASTNLPLSLARRKNRDGFLSATSSFDPLYQDSGGRSGPTMNVRDERAFPAAVSVNK
jgi:hypothetical protein